MDIVFQKLQSTKSLRLVFVIGLVPSEILLFHDISGSDIHVTYWCWIHCCCRPSNAWVQSLSSASVMSIHLTFFISVTISCACQALSGTMNVEIVLLTDMHRVDTIDFDPESITYWPLFVSRIFPILVQAKRWYETFLPIFRYIFIHVAMFKYVRLTLLVFSILLYYYWIVLTFYFSIHFQGRNIQSYKCDQLHTVLLLS